MSRIAVCMSMTPTDPHSHDASGLLIVRGNHHDSQYTAMYCTEHRCTMYTMHTQIHVQIFYLGHDTVSVKTFIETKFSHDLEKQKIRKEFTVLLFPF